MAGAEGIFKDYAKNLHTELLAEIKQNTELQKEISIIREEADTDWKNMEETVNKTNKYWEDRLKKEKETEKHLSDELEKCKKTKHELKEIGRKYSKKNEGPEDASKFTDNGQGETWASYLWRRL